ncbi:MAG: YcfL family protein [Victivallales bacterium]|nr:YcfL family protein [Victivallales bacterium]
MLNALKRICLLAGGLLLLAGCLAPKTSGVWVEKGRIILSDPAFAANLEVVRDAREKTAEGFLHAQVTLQNLNQEDFQCQYCFEWRDENGLMQTHAPTPWRPLVFHGGEVKEVDGVSPLQGASDFRLKLRRMD